jgi:hypothetical protein
VAQLEGRRLGGIGDGIEGPDCAHEALEKNMAAAKGAKASFAAYFDFILLPNIVRLDVRIAHIMVAAWAVNTEGREAWEFLVWDKNGFDCYCRMKNRDLLSKDRVG